MMTDRATADLLLSDIAAMRLVAALEEWALNWATVIHGLPADMQAELRQAYQERKRELG